MQCVILCVIVTLVSIIIYSEPLPIENSTVVTSRVLLYAIVNDGRDIYLFFLRQTTKGVLFGFDVANVKVLIYLYIFLYKSAGRNSCYTNILLKWNCSRYSRYHSHFFKRSYIIDRRVSWWENRSDFSEMGFWLSIKWDDWFIFSWDTMKKFKVEQN